jgi:uncharacterized protein (TIRG00374 family)
MVVVVLFSILIFSIRPAEILEAFKDARPRYLVYAVILMIPNLLLQFLKWRFILSSLDPRPSMKTTAVSLFGGFFLGASTPGRTGELARGIFIPGHSKIKTASLTVVDKAFNQLLILIFGLTAAGFYIPFPYSVIPFAAVISVVAIMLNIHRTRPWLERFFHRFTKSEGVDNALAAFDALTWRKSVGLFIFTTFFYATFSFQYYCLIRCFSDFSLLSGIRTIPVIYVINTMFPVAIGDFGVKEMAAVHVLEPFGIAGGPAFSATLTQNVITFLTPALIGGLVFLFSNPIKNQEARSSDGHNTLSRD